MGEGHKEFIPDKFRDNGLYLFTLMAIARELSQFGLREADVHIAAGLPLTWVKTQRESFRSYLMRNPDVRYTFRDKDCHINITGCSVFPLGYSSVVDRLKMRKKQLSATEVFRILKTSLLRSVLFAHIKVIW